MPSSSRQSSQRKVRPRPKLLRADNASELSAPIATPRRAPNHAPPGDEVRQCRDDVKPSKCWWALPKNHNIEARRSSESLRAAKGKSALTTRQISLPSNRHPDPAFADAAQLANTTVVDGRKVEVEIVSADEVNSIGLAADPRAPGRAKSMTAGQNLSPQALSVIAGALAGAAGLFLIFYSRAFRNRLANLEIPTDLQPADQGA